MFALRQLVCRARPSFLLARSASTASSSQAKPDPDVVAKPEPSTSSRFRYVPQKTIRELNGRYRAPLIRGIPRRKKLQRRERLKQGIPARWNRPVAAGVLPAYDQALRIIYLDSAAIRKEFRAMNAKIRELEAENEGENEEKLEKLRAHAEILDVQSQINLPAVRWAVRNLNVDMSKRIHRYLLEQSWRKGGNLDLLMERVYQMNVAPDLVAAIHPSFELRLTTGSRPKGLHPKAKNPSIVEPGSFLLPKQTMRPPTMYSTVFHTDTRLYTMVMLDPDVPDPENQSYTTYLHWMQPNIPLSCSNTSRLTISNDHTPYLPPHPQKGSPYHRYTIFFLLQPPITTYSRNVEARAKPGIPTSQFLSIPVVKDEDRLHFNLRDFTREWSMNPADGGAVQMWREVWDTTVPRIYRTILKKPEPIYGRPPKEDPYAVVKAIPKYLYTGPKYLNTTRV
ncbi:phosphatidylethanolamine-binding protein [Mycena floridula]|nr:phosphatidylethanolamine-binding protein [Mycena floridula]